jgi:hypothetical protein
MSDVLNDEVWEEWELTDSEYLYIFEREDFKIHIVDSDEKFVFVTSDEGMGDRYFTHYIDDAYRYAKVKAGYINEKLL